MTNDTNEGNLFQAFVPSAMHTIMPRPGQPGALFFDRRNVTEFLENWDLECSVYGYDSPERCTRLPSYCDKALHKIVKDLPS